MVLGNHFTNLFNGSKGTIYNVGIGSGIETGNDFVKARISLGLAVLSIPNNIMTRPTIDIGVFFVL